MVSFETNLKLNFQPTASQVSTSGNTPAISSEYQAPLQPRRQGLIEAGPSRTRFEFESAVVEEKEYDVVDE